MGLLVKQGSTAPNRLECLALANLRVLLDLARTLSLAPYGTTEHPSQRRPEETLVVKYGGDDHAATTHPFSGDAHIARERRHYGQDTSLYDVAARCDLAEAKENEETDP